MSSRAIVIGSGAGGSTAAMVLAEGGWDVLIVEKGRNYFGDLRSPTPATAFSNDELKSSASRYFEDPDVDLEPRSFRRTASEANRVVGNVNHLPSTVGGGTTHWDAKTPRFWDIDFKKLSLLGPMPNASVTDWPFSYGEIAPFYDEIESLIGVQGDVNLLPTSPTRAHAPRTKQLPMPPGAPQYSSVRLAGGAQTLGLHPFPVPMAITSQPYQGRPACNDCGFCSHYGCPIHARVGALAPLRRAVIAGAEVRPETFASRVVWSGRRATGVVLVDNTGASHTEPADLVVMAGSTIETIRLALLSRLPNPHDQIGRHLMFHWFTAGFGVYLTERIHAYRGRSTSHAVDDFADPEYPAAKLAAAAAGLPYVRGGVLELGGSQDPIAEASYYRFILSTALSGVKPFGTPLKQLMRASILRDRLAGIEMISEDMPQATNTVDLDPAVKDYRGVPVARITYAPHQHEIVSQTTFIPLLTALIKASGADVGFAIPEVSSDLYPVAAGDVPDGKHIMGGMRMGTDPATSVTDAIGRVHGLDNVVVSDGSVFPTSGSHNPTLTIMATALRNARQWVGLRTAAAHDVLAVTGRDDHGAVAAAAIAGSAAIALRRLKS
ncbi:MAG TPA: GMC family oxidoreductase [Acidimicrobiales bacterium]|nr:GMC family oxidoreductase [Acidimicrobiales bacterium]